MGKRLFSLVFLPCVPWHGLRNAFCQAVRGGVTQQTPGFANVGLAVAHVASAKVAVSGLHVCADAVGGQVAAQQAEQIIQCGAVAYGYVVDLVQG